MHIKLMVEKIILNANDVLSNNKVIFSFIRFGNVIGSRGSVLEIFKKQIKKNQRITLTIYVLHIYYTPVYNGLNIF